MFLEIMYAPDEPGLGDTTIDKCISLTLFIASNRPERIPMFILLSIVQYFQDNNCKKTNNSPPFTFLIKFR